MEIERKLTRSDGEATIYQRQDEIKFLKKRIDILEEDRTSVEIKYSKLNIEHNKCDQEKKDASAKIKSLEAELFQLKERLQGNRKERIGRNIPNKGLNEINKAPLSKNNIQVSPTDK